MGRPTTECPSGARTDAARDVCENEARSSYLPARIDFLLRNQNADGGWPYFPQKQSWLEPTVFAAIALGKHAAAQRALARLGAWQGPSGGWPAADRAGVGPGATALALILLSPHGDAAGACEKGFGWLLEQDGAESSAFRQVLARLHLFDLDRDPRHRAFPWRIGNSSWVEPTSHALTAVKAALARGTRLPSHAQRRVAEAEAFLYDNQCADGGWNYGNRKVLGVELPSYPETTAIAITGLQSSSDSRLGKALDLASKLAIGPQGRMASAWLRIALRLHGRTVPEPQQTSLPPGGDILTTALEAISVSEGVAAFSTQPKGPAASPSYGSQVSSLAARQAPAGAKA